MVRHLSRRVKKIGASIALLSAEMAVVLAVCVVSMFAFVFIARRIFVVGNEEFDQYIFDQVSYMVSPTNNKIMKTITFFGTHTFLIPANLTMIAYYLFIKKHKWYSIKIPAIAISSLLMMFILKNLFGRERPEVPLLDEAKGLSFPSGHALMSMTFYGLIIYIIWKTVENKRTRALLVIALLIWIQLIGFSRVYLKVHYPTDVIAGYAIGFLWLVLSIWMLDKMERYSRKKVDPVVKEPQQPVLT